MSSNDGIPASTHIPRRPHMVTRGIYKKRMQQHGCIPGESPEPIPHELPKPTKRPKRKHKISSTPHASTPSALLIPEVLELILSFASLPSKISPIEPVISLWCNYRLVCKHWKHIIETSTFPPLASTTFKTQLIYQPNSPQPTLILNPLALCLLHEAVFSSSTKSPRVYRKNEAAERILALRTEKYPTMYATYPAVTIIRAFAAYAMSSKKRVQAVNAYASRQHEVAVVSYDEDDYHWYFQRKDGGGITVEQLVAFGINVYEVCGASVTFGKIRFPRVEFMGRDSGDDGVVGTLDLNHGAQFIV
ncbi:hypothetical protein TWF694_005433 [Orbilia ellipsospora]|uniref:F-box domain-containing protein n=1 Tax=Orbilia ellipsospora TaxID=2528407 RepID=A0AAV9WTD2_9PEZI